MWWTRKPGSTSTVAGQSALSARVKTSQLTPERARAALELPDVDVHPAAVARARLGQGRGVHRQDRQGRHHGRSPRWLPAAGGCRGLAAASFSRRNDR